LGVGRIGVFFGGNPLFYRVCCVFKLYGNFLHALRAVECAFGTLNEYARSHFNASQDEFNSEAINWNAVPFQLSA